MEQTIEDKHKLITTNSEGHLELLYLPRLKKNDRDNEKEETSYVVSFLGSTQVGKSHLAGVVMDEEQRPKTTEKGAKKIGSVTTDINLWKAKLYMGNQTKPAIFLDFEGTGGIANKNKTPHSQHVADCYPSLGYILSDVVIFVSKADFANYEFFEGPTEFAMNATKDVNHVSAKPVLIVISNFSVHGTVNDPIEQQTSDWLEEGTDNQNKRETLKQWFSEVYAMGFPFYTDEYSKEYEIFKACAVKLRNLIFQIEARKPRQINRMTWNSLLEDVLQLVSNHQPVSISSLLFKFTQTSSKPVNLSIQLFVSLYKQPLIHTLEWFKMCRGYAIIWLARNLAYELSTKDKYLTANEEVGDHHCLENLKGLLLRLRELEPCMDEHQVSKSNSNDKVICYQHRNAHPYHRAHQARGFFVPSWSGDFNSQDQPMDELLKAVFPDLKRLTKMYLEDIRRDPKFLYTSYLRVSQTKNLHVNTVSTCHCCLKDPAPGRHASYFERILSGSVCVTCYKILSKESNQVEKNCPICLKRPSTHCVLPCKHTRLCQECAKSVVASKKCPTCNAPLQAVGKI